MKTTIQVTQQDIDNGLPGECDKCPVALAIKRALPTACKVEVSEEEIEINYPPGSLPVLCVTNPPFTVQNFIRDFDRLRKVSEFSFELEV